MNRQLLAKTIPRCAPALSLSVVLLLALPSALHAQYTYWTNNDGTLTLGKYTGSGKVVSIPSTIHGRPVTGIGYLAFGYCFSLRSITIPDTVTSIDGEAFAWCTNLTSITIPNSISSIGRGAFGFCFGLRSLSIPESVSSLGEGVFQNCTALTNVTLPSRVTTIEQNTFASCWSLRGLAIPESVTSIGDNAFSVCWGLTNLTLPKAVTNIGQNVFYYSTNLTAITVDELNPSFSSVDGVVFDKGQTMLVAYPPGKAGSYTIPSGVTQLQAAAFKDCERLTDISFPESLRLISSLAFANCTGLTGISLPASLTTIEDSAFCGCFGLTKFNLPSGVTSIGEGVFSGCYHLQAVTVDALNPSYCSVDGVLFDKSQTVLLTCPANKWGSYTIPSSVTRLGAFAFDGCAGLTSLSIPGSVTNIGRGTFNNCCGLTRLSLPSGVRSIPDLAFLNCSTLTNLTLPDSLTEIGMEAFAGCYRLSRLTIPKGVTSLQDWAFVYCSNLAAVYFTGDAPSLTGSDLFTGDSHARVYYRAGSVGWGKTFGGLPTSRYQPMSPTYHGLFYEHLGVRWPKCGGFTLSTTAQGKFTGKLMCGGGCYSLSGAFDALGHAGVTIVRPKDSALQVELQLAGSEQITGRVTGTFSNETWTADLAGDRAGFDGIANVPPQQGQYTLVLPGDLTDPALPGGTGCATLSVDKSGRVRLSGVLADGTKLTQAVALSGQGVWPLYVALYRGQGLLTGWFTFTNTPEADLGGALHWFKPSAASSKYYPDGFMLETTAVGSHYTRPASGAKVLGLGEARLVFSGAGLTEDVTSYLTLENNSRVTSTNKTRLTFTASAGTFQGSAPNPYAPAAGPISLRGVVLQKQNFGCGWFLGPNQCGQLYLGN